MADKHSLLKTAINGLHQIRDELQLQLHLAEMDGKQEYERLTDKVDELTRQYEPVKDAIDDTTENVFAALLLAADEVQHGFDRVRTSLKGK